MIWFQQMAIAANDTNPINIYQSAAVSTAESSQYILTWNGLAQSPYDGYEVVTGQQNVVQQFTADTTDWPHRVEWGNQHRSYIRITINPATATGIEPQRVFHFYYGWTGQYPQNWPEYQHIDEFTGQFEPISREQELAPETFLKWLERIGHDDAFLRVSYNMQKKMMDAIGHKPPWDLKRVEELEQERLAFVGLIQQLNEEEQKSWEDKLYERWGVREIPPITPELLDQIAESSLTFLKECLSEEELKWYDEKGHLKVKSTEHSNIFYIIEKKPHGTIKRYVNGKHEEDICYQSKWSKLPLNDTLAMKILDIKWNERGFLKVGNRRKIRAYA